MFTKTLSKNATGVLALLGKSKVLKDAYLAGGTACALQLGHRISADIAAMKIDAICSRGTKRDFIDLYFLIKKKFTLEEILKFYDKKYNRLSNNIYHITKSLTYFMDADPQDSPKMLIKYSWQEIKKFFKSQTIKLAKSNLET